MVKPPIVWGNLSFREEGRPDQKKVPKNITDSEDISKICKYFQQKHKYL